MTDWRVIPVKFLLLVSFLAQTGSLQVGGKNIFWACFAGWMGVNLIGLLFFRFGCAVRFKRRWWPVFNILVGLFFAGAGYFLSRDLSYPPYYWLFAVVSVLNAGSWGICDRCGYMWKRRRPDANSCPKCAVSHAPETSAPSSDR